MTETNDKPYTGPRRSALALWAQLLRLPNLLTVPGDPLAGFLLAGGALVAVPGGLAPTPGKLWLAAPATGVSLLLYCFGLVTNDLLDLPEDRKERPGRPLPARQIPAALAILAALICLVLGNAIAWWAGPLTGWITAGLTLAILSYNVAGKRIPLLGPLNMGICRGLSLLLGAAVAGWWWNWDSPAFLSAVFLSLYVAAVTQLAAGETRKRRIGRLRHLPAAVVLLWYVLLLDFAREHVAIPYQGWPFYIAMAVLGAAVLGSLLWLLRASEPLTGEPEPAVVQKGIGRLLQGLLLIQATLAAMTGYPGVWVALALAAALPLAVGLSRRFYAS